MEDNVLFVRFGYNFINLCTVSYNAPLLILYVQLTGEAFDV